MSAGDVETFHVDGEWWNRVEGHPDRQGPYAKRDEAVSEGRDMARNLQVEHIIHGVDGRIHERNSYGNDQRDIPG